MVFMVIWKLAWPFRTSHDDRYTISCRSVDRISKRRSPLAKILFSNKVIEVIWYFYKEQINERERIGAAISSQKEFIDAGSTGQKDPLDMTYSNEYLSYFVVYKPLLNISLF